MTEMQKLAKAIVAVELQKIADLSFGPMESQQAGFGPSNSYAHQNDTRTSRNLGLGRRKRRVDGDTGSEGTANAARGGKGQAVIEEGGLAKIAPSGSKVRRVSI